MTIYVVMGSTGDYSGRIDWPVRAWTSEDQARDWVLKATEAAKICEASKPSQYSDPVNLTNPYDPHMKMEGYSGTVYFYYTVELKS